MKTVKIAIAPDSFKGTLTALEAAEHIEKGLRRGISNISVRKIPMADGGEGTVRAIVEATGGRFCRKTVQDPLGRKIKAVYGLSGDGKTVVIEMAAASGLALLKRQERNPMVTSTYGTGELIKDALKYKPSRVLVGIGGSATNDGGTGMARALGVKFLDIAGKSIAQGGGPLKDLARIDMSELDNRIANVSVEVACDVDNPLTGRHGAARVYAPQKGASPVMVNKLNDALRHFARIISRDVGVKILKTPGSGAAGGLGAGLMAFLNAELRPGIDIVIDSVKLKRKLKGCDLVITGEGQMDEQTVYGKTPSGVARVAGELGIPVIAICGSLGRNVHKVRSVGIHAYFSAIDSFVDEDTIAKKGPAMLIDCAEQVGRALALNFTGRTRLRFRK